ncbi:MAG: bifunctional adenosylcobinamide kinase/adenosylcobinamide-phosphate guanylyltransferase [Lentisphaerae bacterium GWF2_45_14]|nr:MAG: bifunctional adenosylcobinamide kinase/adenosylcobinamide-phosphate guanylyltransferase [Lentisphaerae bacterium GWF2_45_14]
MKTSTFLVTGGARSGKSRIALSLAEKSVKPFYIATGWAGDSEMDERIRIHKADRGGKWTLIEEKMALTGAIEKAVSQGADFILVDCLTLWISNLMMLEDENLENRTTELLETIRNIKVPLAFVSNEVGCGIVPGDPISRRFRDDAGFVNQKIAQAVENVILAVSGIPVLIKKSGVNKQWI